MLGFLLVYVDDLMITSDEKTIRVVIGLLQALWETSPPEDFGEQKVKFLGMEITRTPEGGFRASQEDYIKDQEGIPESERSCSTLRRSYSRAGQSSSNIGG